MIFEDVVLLTTAALAGSMVFFAVVVAPAVFRALGPADAGTYLRALFPRYYAWGLVVTGIAFASAVGLDPLPAALLGGVAVLFVYARWVLLPMINASRDAELAGDEQAGRRFERLHRWSVIINGVQLITVLAVFVSTSSR